MPAASSSAARTCSPPASPVGSPATSGSPCRRADGHPAATRRRAVRGRVARGARSAATSGATARSSTWCTAGAAAAASSRRTSSRWSQRATGSCCSTRRLTATPSPARPGHGRTHGVEFGKALDAVFARFGPAHAVIAHSLGTISTYLALRFGWLCTERLVLLAPMVEAVSLFDQFQRALGFGRRTRRAFDRDARRLRRHPDRRVRRRWSRPRTASRCRRWSCTTAATGRRRTPTPCAWSTGCRTPDW